MSQREDETAIMDAQFATLALVTERLDSAGIPYMVSGSIALTLLLWLKKGDSGQQRRDLEMLSVSIPQLDWDYVETWAAQLGVADLLHEVRG